MKRMIRNLLFPPKCLGCGERLNIFTDESLPAFCLACRVKWEAALEQDCSVCLGPLSRCTCAPKCMTDAGASGLYKLCYYSPERKNEIATHLVLSLKDSRLPRGTERIARTLALRVSRRIEGDAEVVYIPRTSRGALEKGFDQGAELAHALARAGGWHAPVNNPIRRLSGAAQKALGKTERAENAAAQFRLARGTDLKGKTVLLVDDIVTTGASMAACCRLLKQAGASTVICACVAITREFRRNPERE